MICTKCGYFDVVPGTRLCIHCAREPLPKAPTRKQQTVAALQDTIDMLLRENTRLRELVQEQNTIIDELNELMGTV